MIELIEVNIMKDNQLYFNIKDNKVKISWKEPISFADFLTIVCTGLLTAMKSMVSQAPKADRHQVTEELYDMFNAAASNTLSYFAPEIEMRPHLTSQAILDAEDNLIDRELQRKQKDPTYKSKLLS
jgi:hypothetical protein